MTSVSFTGGCTTTHGGAVVHKEFARIGAVTELLDIMHAVTENRPAFKYIHNGQCSALTAALKV